MLSKSPVPGKRIYTMPEMTTRFNMVRRKLLRTKHRGGVIICQLDMSRWKNAFQSM